MSTCTTHTGGRTFVRQIYRHRVHTLFCDRNMNQMQEKVRKYMTDKPEYRAQNLNYMRYEMKMMEQEDLIDQLKEMNLKELQYCQGAGVPGHANTVVLQLLKMRKDEMQKYLESQGSKRIDTVDSEKPQDQVGELTVDEKGAWYEAPTKTEEELIDAKLDVHTSKKGRKSNR